MKKISFLLTVILLCSVAMAQPVRRQFAYEQREGDTRPKPDLTLRKLSGETLSVQAPSPSRIGKGESKGVRSTVGWVPNGLCILDTTGAGPSEIVTDGQSGAIICWTEWDREFWADTTHKTYDIYIQRVDSDGFEKWPHQGVPVCSLSGSYSMYPVMVSDGQGGAIIAWEDDRGGLGYARVFAQRLDSLGNRLWPENGVVVCNQMSGYVDLCTDGHGGAIITYVDGRDEAVTSDNIYAQRIDSAGNPVWAIDGVPVCTADSIQFWPAITNNDKGGAVVAWQDYRNGNYDIYVQKVEANGNLNWASNGIEAHTLTSQHEQYAKLIQNNKGGAIVSWIDYGSGKTYTQSVDSNGIKIWNNSGVNTLGTYGDLNTTFFGGGVSNSYAAQRVDSSGNLKWGGGILLHKDTTGGQCGATEDGEEGIIVVWDDYHANINYANTYVQKVDSNGNILWGDSGVALCTLQLAYETWPQITSDGLGGAIATWCGSPIHGASHIYTQRIDSNGIPRGVEGTPNTNTTMKISNLKLYPNPFINSANIEYTITNNQNVTVNVYNINGQRVKTLINGKQISGYYKIKWNGRNDQGAKLATGVYLISLRTERGNIIHKFTIIK